MKKNKKEKRIIFSEKITNTIMFFFLILWIIWNLQRNFGKSIFNKKRKQKYLWGHKKDDAYFI